MSRCTLWVCIFAAVVLIVARCDASDTAPLAQINYQGKLTDATGVPVSDGAHALVFKFFQAQTGGTSLWESTKSVQTTGGLFSTVISSLPGDMFRGTLGSGSELWLEIVLDGSTLSPRTRIVGVPYSTVAGFALDLADNTVTSAQIRDGAVTASKLAPGAVTIPQGHGSGLDADLLDGLHANGFLRVNGDNTAFDSLFIHGLLIPSIGQTKGLSFASGYGGDTGDVAWLRYYPSGRAATAMNLDLGLANDANDQLNLISPGGVYVQGDLTVTGMLNATLPTDSRYLRNDLAATSVQTVYGDIDVRSGAAPGTSYLHPGATDARNWGAVASQVFCSPNYYGPNPTSTITIGESNPVSIPGTVTAGTVTAPAFNDTTFGYYVDPAGTSVMARLDANTVHDRANPAYYVDPDDISILNSVRADRFYSRQDPTNYYLDPDGTSYINDIQAYVFRDRNDPNSYYADPSGTSHLYSIRVGTASGVADNVQTGLFWHDTLDYGIYREAGMWTSPYPDLRIAFQTGIKLGAESLYGGVRFFNGSDMATEIFSVGSGDNNVRVNNALYSPNMYDKDDPSYCVDPASTSNVNNLTVNGSISRPAGQPNLPIAYGFINSSGTKASGTSNVTSTWESAKARYVITISGETYSPSSYVTTVTVSNSAAPYIATTSNTSGGDLVVRIFNLSGTAVQADFQFVTYKP